MLAAADVAGLATDQRRRYGASQTRANGRGKLAYAVWSTAGGDRPSFPRLANSLPTARSLQCRDAPPDHTGVAVILFRNVDLIDGLYEGARPGCDVLVDGERIAAVEPADPARDVPAETTVIVGDGKTLLPGLIDCHVHYTAAGTPGRGEAARAYAAAGNARRALEAGVTTARSGGSRSGLDIRLRDAIAAGDVAGPRLLAAGPALTITGGHGREFGRELDGPDAFVGAVRANVRDGADVIKIIAAGRTAGRGASLYEAMSQAEIDAVVAEASRLGRRVMSHAETSEAFERSVWAGVASVEHGFVVEESVPQILAGRATAFVPTLVVSNAAQATPGVTAADRDALIAVSEWHARTVEAAMERGVRALAGTDCGSPGVEPDMLAREIRLLHEHGATAMDAVRAATHWAAELLGLEAEVGIVQPGLYADLVLVDGDPLTDLRRLEGPRLVVQRGAVVHGTA
jgi:imidazolonepropionase-like amidohydrolase